MAERKGAQNEAAKPPHDDHKDHDDHDDHEDHDEHDLTLPYSSSLFLSFPLSCSPMLSLPLSPSLIPSLPLSSTIFLTSLIVPHFSSLVLTLPHSHVASVSK